MASIKQYRGKTWRAIIRRTGFPSQSKTFDFKKDAEAWVAEVEASMGVSRHDPLQLQQAKRMTVRELFERYEREVAPGLRGRNSRGVVKRLIRDAAFMPMLVSRIGPADIKRWRSARLLEVQPASVQREFNTISGVFKHGIQEWHLAITHPCRGIGALAGADKARSQRWSQQDTEALLKAVKWSENMELVNGRSYVGWALLLAIETAMREGELCSLRVSDFYPSEQRVHLEMTKNGESRDVPLSTAAIRYLKILCANKKPEDKIFPIVANTLSEYVLDARRLCGLEHLTFHDSRHEAATRLSKKLSNVLELSAVTGHKSLRSLKRYYNPTPAEIAGKLG
jgi:integrase